MIASESGHLDVVKALIEAGAKVNQADEVGIYVHVHCCIALVQHAYIVHVHVHVHICHNTCHMGTNNYMYICMSMGT